MTPTLCPGHVHVWTAALPPILPPGVESALSSPEQQQANRFQFLQHRSAYVFAHAVLRHVLSVYLHCPPGELSFYKGPLGKPHLAEPLRPTTLEFNLSHSGALTLIALSLGRRVGVDVEEILPINELAAVVDSHFTPLERAYIFGQPLGDRTAAFFRCWTRKEAYIKAIGKGLSIPLSSFDTIIPAGQPGRQLAGMSEPSETAHWWIADLMIPAGYMAAVAVENNIEHLAYFECNPFPG